MLVMQSPIIHYFTTVFLVYIAALALNKLVNVYGFYSKTPICQALFMLLDFSDLVSLHFRCICLCTFFLIVGLGYLFQINRQESAIGLIFGTALTFGIASILTRPCCHYYYCHG